MLKFINYTQQKQITWIFSPNIGPALFVENSLDNKFSHCLAGNVLE